MGLKLSLFMSLGFVEKLCSINQHDCASPHSAQFILWPVVQTDTGDNASEC